MKPVKPIILDNNPISIACYLEEHPEFGKELIKDKGVRMKTEFKTVKDLDYYTNYDFDGDIPHNSVKIDDLRQEAIKQCKDLEIEEERVSAILEDKPSYWSVLGQIQGKSEFIRWFFNLTAEDLK